MLIRASLWCLLALPALLAAQADPPRSVTHNRLRSPANPAAVFVIDTTLRFVGGQTIDILNVAGAEQYFFAEVTPDSNLQRFYWFQFEHYYPTNTYTYDYSGFTQLQVTLKSLPFVGDIRTIPNYFGGDSRPGSDSDAAARFLQARGLLLDGTFVTLRLFHLPDSSRRRELMIIYGERLPRQADSARVRAALLAHARAGLSVQ